MTRSLSTEPARLFLSILFTAAFASASFGEVAKTNPSNAQRRVLIERHKKLADMHSKIAQCLESEKALGVCKQEMVDACASNFDGTCPNMGMGKRGRGGKGMMSGSCMDWMMGADSDTTTAPVNAQPGK